MFLGGSSLGGGGVGAGLSSVEVVVLTADCSDIKEAWSKASNEVNTSYCMGKSVTIQ